MLTRNNYLTSFLAGLLLVGSGTVCLAQTAVVHLDNNLPAALVFADSTYLGAVNQGPFTVPTTARTLRVVPPRADAWTVTPLVQRLDLAAGDTVHISLPFDYHYRVSTLPFGMPVFLETAQGRVKLGETPLTYRAASPLTDPLLIDAPGFHMVRLDAGTEVWNVHNVALRPVDMLGAQPSAEVAWAPPRKPRRWIDYAALGTALASGAVAIHYKFKADRRFDEYELNGDPLLRPAIDRYDNYSGIALGTMQVGLGVFAFRLIFR